MFTLHKTPYKEQNIAELSRCLTKHPSEVLTTIFLTVRDGLQKHCDDILSTSVVSEMWILKNSYN